MTTRALGPGAGWGWLKQAINLGGQNPKAIFGAAGLLLLVALVPTLLQIFVQQGLGLTDTTVMAGLLVFSMLYSLLVMAPLIAGFLRVIHAAETGAPTRPAAVFRVFAAGGGALRMIALMLLIMVIVLTAVLAIGAAFGGEFFAGIATAMMAMSTAAPGSTPALPAMPDGIGAFLALLTLVGLFINGVYAIAVGQVALTGRSVFGSIGDGFIGTLKNLLPLLVLLVIAIVLGIAFMLLGGLLIALLVFIGGLVHPVMAIVLAAPVYLAALLVVYVVMFGVIYFMWREICGGDAASAAVPVAAGNQVEM